MKPPARARLCLAFLFVAVSAGCLSRPTPPYRRVDTEAPEFKAEVAREAALAKTKGKSGREAEKIALRRVTRKAIDTEKNRRTDRVAPLAAALDAFDRPRGCWAYTTTTTTRKNHEASTIIERFDAFQPEERLWTLLSRDGRRPTDEEQASYRRARLRAWQKQQARAADRTTKANAARLWALNAEFEVERPASGPVTFTFQRDPMRLTGVISMPAIRESYVVDEPTQRVLRHTSLSLGTLSGLGGSVKVERFAETTDYLSLEPALPPFPARKDIRYRARHFGRDTGDVIIEIIYSDYKRVKCYDDRFEVRVGPTDVLDYLPDRG